MDPKRRAALDQATAGAYAGATGFNSYTGGFPNQSHFGKKRETETKLGSLGDGKGGGEMFWGFFSGKKAGQKFYNGKKREDDIIFFGIIFF